MNYQMFDSVSCFYSNSVNRFPNNTAFIDGKNQVTYSEFSKKVAGIAEYLMAHYERGSRIGIYMHRCIDMYASIWAVMQSGMVYIPLDAGYPMERVEYIIKDSGMSVMLCDKESIKSCKDENSVCVQEIPEANPSSVNFSPCDKDDNIAIFYTSGSSGVPKGVVTKHQAMSAQIYRFSKFLGIDENSVFIFRTPISFHASIFEYLMCMYIGAKAVILESGAEKDTDKLISCIQNYSVTELFVVPALIKSITLRCRMKNTRLDSLKRIWSGGEKLYQSVAEQMLKYSNAKFYNILGGSEYAGIISAYECKKSENNTVVPIGNLFEGLNYVLLDENGLPSDEGILYIDANQTGSSYLHDDLNEGRFISYKNKNGETFKMFCSNDVLRLSNGVYTIEGRADDVIKIRGMRVDLNGVENSINEVEFIKESVIALKDDKLYAFIVSDSDDISDSELVDRIVSQLKCKLPSYMIPSVWNIAQEIPKLTSGKANRKNIFSCNYRSVSRTLKTAPPSTDLQREIYDIWCKILKRTDFGIEDSFMEIGGVSIEVVEMMSIIGEKYNIETEYSDFINEPTISGLEKMILSAEKIISVPAKKPAPFKYEGGFPLTELQQSYFVGRQEGILQGEISTHGYMEITVRKYSFSKVKETLSKMLSVHSSLRIYIDKQGVQHIAETAEPDIYEYVPDSDKNMETALSELRTELNKKSVNIEKAPLFEVHCVTNGNGTAVVAFLTDNIVFDGISSMLFINEFINIYSGKEETYQDTEYSFQDYVHYLSEIKGTPKYQLDKKYWLELSKSFPSVMNPPSISNANYKAEPMYQYLDIPENIWNGICGQSNYGGVSVFSFILTAVIQMLSREMYENRFLISIPEENRPSFDESFRNMLGEFSSFLLFPCSVNKDESFLESAKRNQKLLWKFKQHDSFSAIELMRELNKSGGSAYSSTVPVVFTSLLEQERQETQDIYLSHMRSYTTQISLEIVMLKIRGNVRINFTYLSNILSDKTVSDMVSMLYSTLEKAVQNPEIYVTPDLPSADFKVIEEVNNTSKDTDFITVREKLLQSFEKNAERTALADFENKYSYRDIKKKSLCVSAEILKKAENEKAVAVLMQKGIPQIIAIIGTVLSGKAYMPLEYGYPSERISACLKNAGITTVITDESTYDVVNQAGFNTIVYENISEDEKTENIVLPDTSELFAFINTSGSTGVPKSVKVRNDSIMNCLTYTLSEFSVGKDDTAISLTNVSHDMSMFDIFGMLLAGGCLVVPDESNRRDSVFWNKLIDKYNVTIWNSVPAFMENYLSSLRLFSGKSSSLRLVFLGGDKVDTSLYGRLKKISPSIQLVSVGGPTETTLWNIWHTVTDEDMEKGFIPYGKPIQNTKYFILNENLEPLPIGTEGVMYCSGICLSDGYAGLEKENKERFVHLNDSLLIYNTGDAGMFTEDGNIRITGRKDSQVKILGKRIELGEIEYQISKIEGIKKSVVCADNNTLVAFIQSEKPVDSEEIRNILSENLPDYMIPSEVYNVENIPLTVNGKVDKQKLLESASKETENPDREYIFTKEELQLHKVIAEVLGVERISPTENLYSLGMNSLNAILIVNKLKLEDGISVPIKELINKTCIRDIAKTISDERHKVVRFNIDSSKRKEPFNLTELQEAYVVGRNSALELGGRPSCGYGELECESFNRERFVTALRMLMERHDVLRLVIYENHVQQVKDEIPFIDVPVTDISDKTEEEQKKYIDSIRKRSEKLCIPLEEYPKFRFIATKLSDKKYIVHMYFDLLIADGWSINLFLDELDALYTDIETNLHPVDVTFRDYCEYKNFIKSTEKYQEDKNFWLKRITALPEAVTLPLLCEPLELKEITNAQEECSLSEDEWKIISELAQKYSVTPFAILFTVFNSVIIRWNKKQKLLMCMPETDRPLFHSDIPYMMGECSSFYVFTAEHLANQTFAEAVTATQEQLWELYEHNSFTGVEILREIYKQKNIYGQALIPIVFSTILNYQSEKKRTFDMIYDNTFTSQIMIDIDVQRVGNRIKFNWNYVKGLLDGTMIKEMAGLQMQILRNAIKSPDFWKKPFYIPLPERDREIIDSANSESEELVITENVNSFINRSFELHSQNPCIIYKDRIYTYEDVFKAINYIGGVYRLAGLKAGDSVAIYCEKSDIQILSVISAVYYGIVYIPLEYELPVKTVQYCLKNCGCKAVVTSESKASAFTDDEIKVFTAEKIMQADSCEIEKEPCIVSLSDRFAIIHTSGSTGMPKPVAVKQQGIVNSLLFTISRYKMNSNDKALCLTNIAHDMSMFDMFGLLMCGGTMIIPEHIRTKDPDYWLTLIERNGVTLWNSVPAMLEMLIAVYNKQNIKTIRLVISGGDYLLPETAKTIFELIPDVQLVNVGGPTETTLWNIYHDVTPEEAESGLIPYGKPISNTKYIILNDAMEEVPIDVTGMMYCAGIGITEGYVNAPELTAQKYVKLPYSDTPMYCTGDLGKYDENGNIIFMGRSDRQIKINGKRIELSGINEIIRKYEGVQVSAVKLGSDGKSIFAYYTAEKQLDEADMKNFVLEYLPQYMVPKHIMRLDEIPLTHNGKLDTNVLPENYEENVVETEENLTETEKQVLKFCRILLNDNQIKTDTNFFMAGGTSLTALQVLKFIQDTFSVAMTMTDIFTSQTIKEWCDKIKEQECK